MKPWHILVLFAITGVALAIWIYQSKLSTTTPRIIQENNKSTNLSQRTSEKIGIEGSDGVKLVGELYRPNQLKTGVILFHMLGGRKEDWDGLIDKLVENHLSVLSVDLRGHGESTGKDNDYQLMREDATKWVSFLKSRTDNQEVFLIGASIGANFAVETAKDEPMVKRIVLLSPGLEYRGINIEKTITGLKIPILAIVSTEDQYSFSSTRALKEKNNSIEVTELENAGHGTRMLSANPNLTETITNWLIKK